MSRYPGFGVLLARLLEHLRMDAGALAVAAGVDEAELQSAVPSPPLLRRLAPALNLHLADLFVIAEAAVPDELAPLDAQARREIVPLVQRVQRLPQQRRQRLLEFARSLPQQDRTRPVTQLLSWANSSLQTSCTPGR